MTQTAGFPLDMAVFQKGLTSITNLYQDCKRYRIISDNKQYLKCT